MERRWELASQVDRIIERIGQLPVLAFDDSSQPDGRPFISRHALQQELSRDSIKKLLDYVGIRNVDVRTIYDHHICVFGILLRIRKYEYIPYFVAHEHFADDCLPFRDAATWSEEHRTDFFAAFYESQWAFCAQKFRSGRLDNVVIHPHRILPFVNKWIIQEGSDSIVEKVEIHSDYNELVAKGTDSKPLTKFFVLKSYPSKNVSLYENEVRAYKMLRHEDILDNLVQFHGSWTQGQRHNILLEYVDGGTLADLFKCGHPTSTEDRLRFWKQLIRLLNPLCRIHCHTDPDDSNVVIAGIHQDIKPENILVGLSAAPLSEFDCNFKIVDLGLTYFHSVTEQKAKSRIRDARGTQMFSAPECYRNERDQVLGHNPRRAEPSKDIWSLGCVFSLALVWSVLGANKVNDYQSLLVAETDRIPELGDTAYSGCFHDGNKMLPMIRTMHTEVLNAKGANDQIISDLVLLIEQMLDVAEARPSADRLRELCNRALERAIAMSTSDQSVFPPSLRITSDPASPPVTPPKVPLKSRRRSEGLRIDGVPFPDSPLSSGSTMDHNNNRSSYMPESPVRSNHENHISIDTVMSKNPSLSYEDESRGAVHGGASRSSAVPPSSNSAPYHYSSSSGDWVSPSQPYVPANNGFIPRTTERPISGYQSPVNEDQVGVERNASRRTNRESIQSHRKQSNRPFASISQVDAWIEKKKANTLTARPVLEDDIDALKDRDQIFIVDNSESMAQYRSEVKRTLGSLGYLVKKFDPDGIEVYFSRSSKTARHNDRARLLALFDTVPFQGEGGMETTLAKILDKCTEPSLLSSMFKRKKSWGVSIYVLTDGVWGCQEECLCKIPNTIKTTVAKMKNRVKLGIQFIQFGKDPVGTWRLHQLDDEWEKHGIDKDIIDTTPYDGNVYKMLLGSFDSSWDDEPSSATDNIPFPFPRQTASRQSGAPF